MKNTIKYAFVGALLAATPFVSAAEGTAAEAKKCKSVYESASQKFAKSPEKVLELVAKLVAANESCAGSVVKAAIVATEANNEMVAQIVETAATAAPKQLSQITASAMSVAPGASKQIAAAALKINSGTAAPGNKVKPLDTPGANGQGGATVGNIPGANGAGGINGSGASANGISNAAPNATRGRGNSRN